MLLCGLHQEYYMVWQKTIQYDGMLEILYCRKHLTIVTM